jgi:hypothetical protein
MGNELGSSTVTGSVAAESLKVREGVKINDDVG